MTRSNIPDSLPSLIGLPYGFRGEGGGVDCWQLVRRAARELYGIDFPNPACPTLADASAVMRAESVNWIPVADPLAGDVVLFTLRGEPLHAGLVIGRGRFLHVLKGRASCVERLDGVLWHRRIEGFYRWPRAKS